MAQEKPVTPRFDSAVDLNLWMRQNAAVNQRKEIVWAGIKCTAYIAGSGKVVVYPRPVK